MLLIKGTAGGGGGGAPESWVQPASLDLTFQNSVARLCAAQNSRVQVSS